MISDTPEPDLDASRPCTRSPEFPKTGLCESQVLGEVRSLFLNNTVRFFKYVAGPHGSGSEVV